jgi:hypothetical protein
MDFLTPEICEYLTSWWLVNRRRANTPNWDIVSTCTIEGREGLILVEAKAHDKESDCTGKLPGDEDNHEKIGTAIRQANSALNATCPGWAISRDSHYQLSNRFAWTWKVASLGVPVILVYLGFLHADEMARRGKPFISNRGWRSAVLEHGAKLVPEHAWETGLQTSGATIRATIRSLELQWVASPADKE